MIEISVLGPLRLRADDETNVDLALAKVQALFAYLVVEPPHEHRRELLADLLWPDYAESSARVNLRQTLKRLRQALPADALLATRQSIGINPSWAHTLDLTVFQRLLESHRAQGTDGSLRRAVDLYRGEFLDQLWVEESARFEEWVLLKREWLRREVLDALHLLTEHALAEHRSEEAIQFARRQLLYDSLSELACQQLMRALAQGGRRAEALQQFDLCRRTLQEELQSEPSPALVHLAAELRGGLNGESRTGIETDPGRDHTQTQHKVPCPATPIVGREHELAALHKLATDSDVRLVTIAGPGGIGKTRLALAFLQRLAEEHQMRVPNQVRLENASLPRDDSPLGIYFVPFQGVTDVDAMAPVIAEAIGFRFVGSVPPRQQLVNYLAPKRVLLCLDNVEHLLEGVDLLVELLRECSNLRLLVTSRERLNLRWEQLFTLDGLAYPLHSQGPADTYPAVRLFLQTARRNRHDFAPDEQAMTEIASICRRVEGMPLALELAAGWVHMLPVQEIARSVVRSWENLASTARDLPARHRSMRTVFDVTWEQLSAEEQACFARLSIFRGGFTRAAAAQIADATMLLLASLVNRSLVRYDPVQDRYSLHELLRQYGQEQLALDPDVERFTRDRHSAHYCAWLVGQEDSLQGLDGPIGQTPLAAAYENLCLAWEWSVTQALVDRLIHVVHPFGLLMMRMARYHEGAQRFMHALQWLDQMEAGRTAAARYVYAQILTLYGDFLHFLGDNPQARSKLGRALDMLRDPVLDDLDTRLFQAVALGCLGDTMEGEEAQKLYEESLDLAVSTGSRWHEARALGSLSELLGLEMRAPIESVKRMAHRSLELHRQSGDATGMAYNLEFIGTFAVNHGDLQTARRVLAESMEIRQRLNTQFGIARCHSELGHLELVAGKNVAAIRQFKHAIDIWEELGLPGSEAYDRSLLAVCYLHSGAYEDAAGELHAVLQVQERGATLECLNRTYRTLGLLALARAENAQALDFLQQSVESTTLNAPRGYSLCGLALAAQQLSSPASARTYWDEAFHCAAQAQNYFLTLHVLNAATVLLAAAGATAYAADLRDRLMTHPFIANSRWMVDVSSARPAPREQDGDTIPWAYGARSACDKLLASLARGGNHTAPGGPSPSKAGSRS